MELGNQIKALRQGRGITQETLAEKLGVSAQAVSKWERGATVPDVQLLPDLSAYFGVTIDELFALSDETRMERIQNMVWDERELNPETMEREEAFLLDRARREQKDAKPYELLAQLHNHKAKEHQERAAEYAKSALERNWDSKDGYCELIWAMGGRYADWCASNHSQLIDWLEGYVNEHPGDWHGPMFLMDQLLDDQRFGEARAWCDRLAKIDHTFRTPLYRGLICWYEGDREKAMQIWEQMQRDFPEDWMVWFSMGDVMARASRWQDAIAYYRKALETQKPPRYTDGTTSIAQVCEIIGDIPGAIAAHEEEIRILAEEWDTTTGETVDQHRREIARLKVKL